MVSLTNTNSKIFLFFFFNATATTEIYTLSLHDALPISPSARGASIPVSESGRRGSWRSTRTAYRALRSAPADVVDPRLDLRPRHPESVVVTRPLQQHQPSWPRQRS